METFWTIFFLLVIVSIAIIQILMIIKFFQIAKDIRHLKDMAQSKNVQDAKVEFYKWVLIGDKNRAKETLFSEIASSLEFKQSIGGVNDSYKKELQDRLNARFKKELAILGDRVDLLHDFN